MSGPRRMGRAASLGTATVRGRPRVYRPDSNSSAGDWGVRLARAAGGLAPLRLAGGARSPSAAARAQRVVARHEPERAYEALDELRLVHEQRAGPIQDRVVDGAERELHGEAYVGFVLRADRAPGAGRGTRDQRVRKFVTEL